VVTPLDFIYFKNLSSIDSFLLIKNIDRLFNIRKIQLYPYFSLFDNLCGNLDTFIELTDTEDIMNGCKFGGKSHSVGHRSTNFSDFIRTNISGS
jgi:hypothetical protein